LWDLWSVSKSEVDPRIALSAPASASQHDTEQFAALDRRGAACADRGAAAMPVDQFQQQPVCRRAVVMEQGGAVIVGGDQDIDPSIVVDIPEAGSPMDAHIVGRQRIQGLGEVPVSIVEEQLVALGIGHMRVFEVDQMEDMSIGKEEV